MSTRTRDERGGIAVLSAIVAVVMFGFAALAVDVAELVNEKQELHDTLDMAAQAGVGKLPADGAGARAAALANAAANDPEATPTFDFFCVVGAKASGTTYVVDATHIPLSCNPGAAPYTAGTYPGLTCNSKICAIPCVPEQGDLCNTMRARDEKDVPYVLAPVVGIDHGDTGTLTSVACKGACGSVPANPIDMVVVGDRTGSMGSAGVTSLREAIRSLLEFLTPSQHRVVLGTIGRARDSVDPTCPSRPSTNEGSGPWIPIPSFSSDYDNTDVVPPSNPPLLNSASQLTTAVNCLSMSSTGTYLAAPMKEARQLLVGSAARPAPVTKAIIFMTDGTPNEITGKAVPSNSSGNAACTNAVNEAKAAKDAGILVVTIAFNLQGAKCNDEDDPSPSGSSPLVTTKLAEMASKRSDGTASLDDGGGVGAGCDTTAEQNGENADGDYFFCTPTPSALSPIFQTAASSVVQRTRLIRLP